MNLLQNGCKTTNDGRRGATLLHYRSLIEKGESSQRKDFSLELL